MDKELRSKTFGEIFKQSLLACLYTIMLCPIGLLIMLIKNPYLMGLASVGNLALFGGICFLFYRNCGIEDMKTLNANQVLYKNKDKLSAGTRIPTEKEFNAKKGVLVALLSNSIMVFVLVICLILDLCGVNVTVYGGLIKFVFALYWTPFASFGNNTSIYFMFFGVLYSAIMIEGAYLLGAYKCKKQLNSILKTQETIYGKKNK